MNRLIFGLIASFFWASSDVISRIFSNKIDNYLGAVLVSLGMLISTSIAFFIYYKFSGEKIIIENKFYISGLIASGLVNGVGFSFFFRFLQASGNFTQGMPIILISILLISVLYGVLFFKDPIDIKIILGIIFAGISIYLLAK